MKLVILGWYGTETIGDRAILAGLLYLFNHIDKNLEISIGSLNPFFTKRTIYEDKCFYEKFLHKKIEVNLFDSSLFKELEKNIMLSDIIIMGGGPLMDLNELYMIDYAFKFSKLLNKKTGLIGCGIGPLHNHIHQETVISICEHSDIIILRDEKSKNYLIDIYTRFNKNLNSSKISVNLDPSFAILNDELFPESEEKDYIAINLRSFPQEYSKTGANKDAINEQLKNFIKNIATQYHNYKIKLIPMHYFHIGNDDREFLNYIAIELNLKNIIVQNKNLSLEETIYTYKNAILNIGMRYHSVVLQTLISGKNYILDYTEPDKGKINGFIQDIDNEHFYKNRYINMQQNDLNLLNISLNNDTFSINRSLIKKSYINYHLEIVKLFKGIQND